MDRHQGRQWRAIDYVLLVAYLTLFGFFYVGFFISDPRMGRAAQGLLWGLRIGLPLVAMALALLYVNLRSGRVRLWSVLRVISALIILLIIAFPILSYTLEQRARRTMEPFHPYLQTVPTPYVERPADPQRPPIKIFCLGSSTTQLRDRAGRGWPERLEERLRDAVPGRRVDVYNLGRMWYTSEHIFINYAVNLRQHKPDIAIVMNSMNDLLQNADFSWLSTGPFREDYGHNVGPAAPIVRPPSALRAIGEKARAFWYYRPPEKRAARLKVVEPKSFPGLAPFARNLRTLIDLVRLDGGEVVLMTEPSLLKNEMSPEEIRVLYLAHNEAAGPTKRWDLKTLRRGMDEYNAAVKRVAESTSATLIDLDPVVPRTLEFFRHDVHYRDPAFDRIAEHVAAALRKSGLLEKQK